jgi:putative transposase
VNAVDRGFFVGRFFKPAVLDGRFKKLAPPRNKPKQKVLVLGLAMWNLPPRPGFQGLHPDKPVTMYLRHLPHWRQEGATYFVTFRLNDSLPRGKLDELDQLRRDWEQRHPPPRTDRDYEQLSLETMRRVESWLDQGLGSCRLKDAEAASLVVEALHHFDEARYELGSYVVMPNHVHAVVRPLMDEEEPLERILQSWKRYTAREINRRFKLTGAFWQEESYDRIIRDEEHLWRVLQYIGANPAKAGLSPDLCPCWLRPEWVNLGWKFDRVA